MDGLRRKSREERVYWRNMRKLKLRGKGKGRMRRGFGIMIGIWG